MAIKRFGQYLIPIETAEIGLEIDLDGFDGFDDQTLWNFKKDDNICFFINPNTSKKLLHHDFLATQVLEDTHNHDWARVRITDVSTLGHIFKRKPSHGDNDIEELIQWYENRWDSVLKMKEKIKNYRYQPFYNHFLTFAQLNQMTLTDKIETEGRVRGLSKIYAERITEKSIRVISVTDNQPNSCMIYDIANIEHYKSEILKMRKRNQFVDENKFWDSLILSSKNQDQ